MGPAKESILRAVRAAEEPIGAMEIVEQCKGAVDVSNILKWCNILIDEGMLHMEMSRGVRFYTITAEGESAMLG